LANSRRRKISPGIPLADAHRALFASVRQKGAQGICFFNNKGGVGKTTLVANLGAELALNFGARVLVVEADHGKLKPLIRPVRGFKSMKTAYATIKGFEVMRALRKGQAAIFNLTRDIVGEARLIERAFGLGPCALTEAVQLINERLEAA
jgi:hypothetical protein